MKIIQTPKRCGTCHAIRTAIPMPQRLRTALEDLERRRQAQKAVKRARKNRRALP